MNILKILNQFSTLFCEPLCLIQMFKCLQKAAFYEHLFHDFIIIPANEIKGKRYSFRTFEYIYQGIMYKLPSYHGFLQLTVQL